MQVRRSYQQVLRNKTQRLRYKICENLQMKSFSIANWQVLSYNNAR